MELLHFVETSYMPIYEQLQLEEALLRASDSNWCLINAGSSPAIVMGISGCPEKLINFHKIKKAPIPIIKRFSGGGTVVVDHNTLFVTLICNGAAVKIPAFPQHILEWNKSLYHSLLKDHPFDAKENDYIIGERKFGGNAQYIQKGRWLHHSSLLWDFNPDHMEYLLLPPKMPDYRKKREHTEFLCCLKDYVSNIQQVKKMIRDRLEDRFDVRTYTISDAKKNLSLPHRKSTTLT